MTYDMSITPVLIWFFLLKDIIFEFSVIRYDLQTRLQLFKAKIINGVG